MATFVRQLNATYDGRRYALQLYDDGIRLVCWNEPNATLATIKIVLGILAMK